MQLPWPLQSLAHADDVDAGRTNERDEGTTAEGTGVADEAVRLERETATRRRRMTAVLQERTEGRMRETLIFKLDYESEEDRNDAAVQLRGGG